MTRSNMALLEHFLPIGSQIALHKHETYNVFTVQSTVDGAASE